MKNCAVYFLRYGDGVEDIGAGVPGMESLRRKERIDRFFIFIDMNTGGPGLNVLITLYFGIDSPLQVHIPFEILCDIELN